jgi:hypothetical protein
MFEEWYVTRRWSNAATYYTLRFFHEPHLLLQLVTVPEHVPHGSQIMLRGRVIAFAWPVPKPDLGGEGSLDQKWAPGVPHRC